MPSDPTEDEGHQKRRWRDYETAAGNRPVKAFLMSLTSEDRAAIQAEMAIVKAQGMREARHVRGDIYEVRAHGKDGIYSSPARASTSMCSWPLRGSPRRCNKPQRALLRWRRHVWPTGAVARLRPKHPPNHKVSRHLRQLTPILPLATL